MGVPMDRKDVGEDDVWRAMRRERAEGVSQTHRSDNREKRERRRNQRRKKLNPTTDSTPDRSPPKRTCPTHVDQQAQIRRVPPQTDLRHFFEHSLLRDLLLLLIQLSRLRPGCREACGELKDGVG